MKPEDLRDRLKALGIDVDQNTWRKTRAVDPKKLPAVQKQVELLNNFKALIEQQIEKDIKAVDDLKLKIKKLKHGGGGDG